MVTLGTVSNDSELKEILDLQQENIKAILKTEDILSEGFVTVIHNLDLLQKMNSPYPHTIAKSGNHVIGYALSMLPSMSVHISILQALTKRLQKLGIPTIDYIIMGQVCIQKAFRKTGVFRRLYHTMAENMKPHFKYIITEVSMENERSFTAHQAIGFRLLEVRKDAKKGENWAIVCLDL